jgi:dTMP kinase
VPAVRGIFVAFEGVEGAGKSSQVALLAARLRQRGSEPVLVREPGGTPLAEEARRLLLHGADDVGPEVELFLLQVARADLVRRVIRPALESGRLVIADRYELSSRAYQIAGRGLPELEVRSAIALATGGLLPDLYVVLDLPAQAGRERQAAQRKAPDRMERADAEFHRRVADAFRTAAGPGIVHLDGGAPAESVHAAVWSALLSRFPALAG